jgi:hypothetical protein
MDLEVVQWTLMDLLLEVEEWTLMDLWITMDLLEVDLWTTMAPHVDLWTTMDPHVAVVAVATLEDLGEDEE